MTAVVVTGASSGIGAEVARHMLAKGWTVGLIARRADRLEQVAQAGDAMVLPCDVTDTAALERAIAAFIDRTGRLDVLFNNAGVFGPSALIDQVPPAEWDRVLMTNVSAMFHAARLAFGQMRAQGGGRIINNGSISAHSPRAPGSVCYTTSKHAITGMTKALALDGRDLGITCGQIDIGNARTEMVADLTDRARAAGQPEMASMDVADAARAVVHMAELPPEANIPFMTIMAAGMPYMGRG